LQACEYIHPFHIIKSVAVDRNAVLAFLYSGIHLLYVATPINAFVNDIWDCRWQFA